MPTTLVNKQTGEPELIEDQDLDTALASGNYVTPDAVAVHRFGSDTYAAPDIAQQEAAISPTIDPATAAIASGHAIREARNTGVLATAKATLGGAVSGLTMGIADPFTEAQEFNPVASGIGQIGGALAPGLVGDEAGLLGLAADPIDAERATSALSSNMLFAGEATGKLDRGLARAKSALDTAAAIPEDLAGLDKAGLRAARASELDTIEAARVPQRAQLAQDLGAFRQDVKQQKIWLATKGAEDPEIRAIGKRTLKADRMLDNLLDNPKRLAEQPQLAKAALQQQEAALESLMDRAESIRTAEEAKRSPATIRAEIVAGKVEGETGPFSPAGLDAAVDREMTRRFGSTTPPTSTKVTALDNAAKALEQNRAMQQRMAELTAAPSSSRLEQIGAAEDALSVPKPATPPSSLPQQMLQGTVFHKVAGLLEDTPFAPLSSAVGAKASQLVGDLVFGRLSGATAAIADRTAQAVGTILDVAKRANPTLPVLATKTLASVRFAPAGTTDAPKDNSLPELYRAREAEIRSQTAYDETGTPRMTQAARAQMANRLSPIAAANPMVADEMEEIGARRIEFLSSKLPRRPDAFAFQAGPDRWQPSDFAMRSFARYVAAAEDPAAVEERLAAGVVSPEDSEAYHAIYPERAAALKTQILSALPTLQKSLPYQRRLALSLFTGVPVDPAMDPQILAVLQATFAAEPGTAGGTQAPLAQPQFGSVSKPSPTPAQERAQGEL